jgi:hypothetical protein
MHITFGEPLISSFYTLLYRLFLDGPIAVLGPTCFLERCENLGLRCCEGAEVEVFVYVFVGLGEEGGYCSADCGTGCLLMFQNELTIWKIIVE